MGGTIAARNRELTATVPKNISSPTPPQAPTTTRVRYANTGLAVMQWTDLNGTLHKRLYYQDNSDKIRESAWDNSTAFDTAWDVNAISDAVKPGTPIAAAAGYPHASYNYSLVRIAYLSFSAICQKIIHRSRMCITCQLKTNSSSVKLPLMIPKVGKTTISADSTPVVTLPSSLHTEIRTFKTYHKNWLFYSKKKISPVALLKIAIPATARQAIRGSLIISDSHSLKGPCPL